MTWKNKPQKDKPQRNKPQKNEPQGSILGELKLSGAITKLVVPVTLALLAKAVCNIADTAYIGMLGSDIALVAVGVTLLLLLIMVSVENVFAAGAVVLTGRQLGAGDKNGANRTVTSAMGISVGIGLFLYAAGVIFMGPLLRSFRASGAVLPQAKDYTFWTLIATIVNLLAQSMNYAAKAESSVKTSSVATITGTILNVVLDPIFMFEWGFGVGAGGTSLATTVSQFITFLILRWFYMSERSVIKTKKEFFRSHRRLIKAVTATGIPTAAIRIYLAVAISLTNIVAKPMADADLIIAAYGVARRLILIGCYMIMGSMQGYQPAASFSFGANKEERFHECAWPTLRALLVLTVLVTEVYILLARSLIMLSNQNPAVIGYDTKLLISQVALHPALGLCYMVTITFQTISTSKYGPFLPVMRQGLFYVPSILILPRASGMIGIYLTQPTVDILTILVCLLFVGPMKRAALENMTVAMNGASSRGNPPGGNNPYRGENT